MLILASFVAFMVYETIIDGPSWYLEGREADIDLTWKDFVHDCGGATQNRRDAYSIFSWKYRNKVVEWEGQVLRVDGDSSEEYNDVKDGIWEENSRW